MQTAKFDQDAAAYIPGPKVRARYGVTDMTIHRWLHDDVMGFQLGQQPVAESAKVVGARKTHFRIV